MQINEDDDISHEEINTQSKQSPSQKAVTSKSSQILQRTSLIVVVLVFVLHLILVYLIPSIHFQINAPLPNVLQHDRMMQYSKLIISLLFFPAFIFLIARSIRKITWVNTIFIFVCLLSFQYFCILSVEFTRIYPETIINTVTRDEHRYYLTFTSEDFGYYQFYECNSKSMDCRIVFDKTDLVYVDETKIVIDEKSKEIIVYRKGFNYTSLFFSYGTEIRDYKLEGFGNLHDEIYSLYSYENFEKTNYILAKCFNNGERNGTCEIQPIQYSTDKKKHSRLFYDESLDELQFWMGDELIFIFDGEPHYCESNCVLNLGK